MTNAPLTLRQVGEAGWGTHWLSEMGGAISVGDRTMRFWAGEDGASAIPPGIEDELIDALQKRLREISNMIMVLGEKGLDRSPVDTGGFQTKVYSTMRRPGEHRKR